VGTIGVRIEALKGVECGGCPPPHLGRDLRRGLCPFPRKKNSILDLK